MGDNGQQPLPLIMMRELADNVATPLFLVDRNGVLVYYNEAAEQLLGLRFVEAGALTADEWTARWAAEDINGEPLAPAERPTAVAMREKRPSHRPMILHTDGTKRTIEVTAFPLLATANEVVGGVAIFWDASGAS
jgi:PAS domain S-box-containing protein